MQFLRGLFWSGAMNATMEKAPETIPAPPAPATARPPINILELTAVAHSREPSSKTAKKLRNVHYWRSD